MTRERRDCSDKGAGHLVSLGLNFPTFKSIFPQDTSEAQRAGAAVAHLDHARVGHPYPGPPVVGVISYPQAAGHWAPFRGTKPPKTAWPSSPRASSPQRWSRDPPHPGQLPKRGTGSERVAASLGHLWVQKLDHERKRSSGPKMLDVIKDVTCHLYVSEVKTLFTF